ncbi:hypothetical protein [Pseudomonas fluorescens]|uniref:hypothetical protein n=1 Tax=Pseudomonas fluorescens TaxID=294 RepID=UPI00191102D1|nr:hypothetical protein [Pseudomonas fluorescens]
MKLSRRRLLVPDSALKNYRNDFISLGLDLISSLVLVLDNYSLLLRCFVVTVADIGDFELFASCHLILPDPAQCRLPVIPHPKPNCHHAAASTEGGAWMEKAMK